MFFEGIRSERQLMRLAADRLSVRWYLGYNLDEPLPDHSSLTRIRARYGLEVFRRFFEAIVEQCQQAGLVWGRELYFDATQVQANAALDSLTARFAVEARPALSGLQIPEARQGIHGAQQAVDTHLAALFPDDMEVAPATPPCCRCRRPLPLQLSAAQHAELASANATRHDWIAQEGRQQREVHGVYQRTADLRVSTTDPDATPMRLKGGGTHLGYQTHYVVDGGKQRIIVGVLGGPRRGDGESADARSVVARALPLEAAPATGDGRHQVWDRREHPSSRRHGHPRLRAPAGLGAAQRLLRRRQIHL